MKEDTVLKIEDISRRYGSDADGEVVDALDHINLSIKRGEFVSIIGASGCGKTTLLRLIAGLDQPQGGKILLNDKQSVRQIPNEGMCFSREAFSRG